MSESAPIGFPVPIERLAVPPELDGRCGANRAPRASAQIRADTDVEAVAAWLLRYTDSRATLMNYRKEAERLLLWAVIERGMPLSSLAHEDLLRYRQFLANPAPAQRWVIRGGRKPPRSDPAWRPFSGPLSESSVRQALLIVNALFSWLVAAGYLAGNPLALSRSRTRRPAPQVVRCLEPVLWEAVKEAIRRRPTETASQTRHQARARWLFTLLYLCGLRIGEVVDNVMGSFFVRRDRDGVERWWIGVRGKGAKTRLVPATRELMDELARYRRVAGLKGDLPGSDEDIPLLGRLGDPRRRLTRAAAHNLVKEIFWDAAGVLRARGAEFEPLARRCEQASAHWLRHTAGSAMADHLDLRFVRDNLGHESLSTTSGYLHAQDDERHRETERVHRLGW